MAPKSARVKDRKTFRRGRGLWRGAVPCVSARMCRVLRAENLAPGKPAAAPSLTRADSETRHSAMPPHSRGGRTQYLENEHGLRQREHLRDHRAFRTDGKGRTAADPRGSHPDRLHHPRELRGFARSAARDRARGGNRTAGPWARHDPPAPEGGAWQGG